MQGLRAVAVLVVVLFHVGAPVPGGFVGVDMFFVISGFVITGMLRRQWISTGSLDIRGFYGRRFRRLTPALAVMVTVVTIAAMLLLSPLGAQQLVAGTALGAMLLAANFVIARTTGGYFDAVAETNPLLNTWSLSVEEQFYLIFPAILLGGWVLARRFDRGRWPLVLVCAFGGVSLALAVMSAGGVRFLGSGLVLGFYSPFTRAWEFAVGAALALACVGGIRTTNRLPVVIAVVGLVMIGFSLFSITGATPFPGPWTLLPVLGTALLILAGSLGRNRVSQLLSTRPLVRIGDSSYSIYLWHWPFLVFAAILWPTRPWIRVIALGLSLLISVASYRWVEQPIRNMKGLNSPNMRRIVVATLTPPLVAAVALGFTARNAFWSSTVATISMEATPLHADVLAGCDDWYATGPLVGRCVWNRTASGRPVYLVGDSWAGQLTEAVTTAGLQSKRPVSVATTSSCPFVDVNLVSSDPAPWWTPEGCRSAFERTRDWLLEAEAGTVVISSSDYYWDPQSPYEVIDSGGRLSPPDDKLPAYQSGLESVVRNLQERGHQVVIVKPGPSSGLLDPSRCSAILMASGRCPQSVSLEEVAHSQAAFVAAIDRAARSTGSTVVDLRTHLCDKLWCGPQTPSGHLMTRDGSHLTVSASESLAPVFEGVFRS